MNNEHNAGTPPDPMRDVLSDDDCRYVNGVDKACLSPSERRLIGIIQSLAARCADAERYVDDLEAHYQCGQSSNATRAAPE